MRWALLAACAATTPECAAEVRAAEARVRRIIDDIDGVKKAVDGATHAAQDARSHALERSAKSLLAYKDGLEKHEQQVVEFAKEDAQNTRREEDALLFEAEERAREEQAPSALGPGHATLNLTARKQELKERSKEQLKEIAGNLTEELVELEFKGENALLYAEHKEQTINAEYAHHAAELQHEANETVAWQQMLEELEANVSTLRDKCEHTLPTPPPTPFDMDAALTPSPTPFTANASLSHLRDPDGRAKDPDASPQWPAEDQEDLGQKWKDIKGRLQQVEGDIYAHSLGAEPEPPAAPEPSEPTTTPEPDAPHIAAAKEDARAWAEPIEAKDWPTDIPEPKEPKDLRPKDKDASSLR